ncbi:hypothetical protein [Chryseobacterium sp. FH1]|uniref:hypothetical protein n=1 Tax=Chryseobacterium sp. FH1 TaxID=1233951 RepID=UPI00068BF484|nr:hypothetical protein [Chryseobacterium sp. FH1]
MTDFHVFKKNTDAIATNKGFYYQYLSTTKIWLENYLGNISNEIFCEREDDIFELNILKKEYAFRQIKCYSDGFSLQSPEIANSLLNFFKLYLQYKDYYTGLFYFQTNSSHKKRSGKSLQKWFENQRNSNFSPIEFITEVRTTLINVMSEKLRKYKLQVTDKVKISKASNIFKDFEENINSDIFLNFLELVRWEFYDITDTNQAIRTLVDEVKKIILSSDLKIDKAINENFILGYLLNTVIEKSCENKEEDRLLNNEILQNILDSADLKKRITDKLNKEIIYLIESNFEIIDVLAKIERTSEITLEAVKEIRDNIVIENSNIPVTNLSIQVKDWFKAIGYKLELEDLLNSGTTNGFIINISKRRGYDRIFVMCVSESVEITELTELLEYTNKYGCDEGWVITYKRISDSVRNKVEKENYSNLFCYTLDELIDGDIDFTGYFEWLENEVRSKQINDNYIKLYCKKDLFDKESNIKLDSNKYEIEGYVDIWLDDPAKKHISILGQFGTGKTWFTLHYAWIKLQEYKTAMKRGINRPRIPILVALRDFSKAVSIESVFSEFFFKKHNSPIPTFDAFIELNKMGKLLLIFDGFDEMADKIDSQKMINNFWELARTIHINSKVILTCRNEHFPESKQGRDILNAKLKASTQHIVIKSPEFEILELLKLNRKQIKKLLLLHTNKAVVKKVMENKNLMDLASRPIMTELIIDSLRDIEEGKQIDISRIYMYAISKKLNKDIKEERTFTSFSDKVYFMCELSWEMLLTENMNIHYRLIPDRIRFLFDDKVQEQKDIDHWQYDMMGQSMLIRNDDGEYKPSHRSLLEFFIAYKFAGELGIMNNDFLSFILNNNKNKNSVPTSCEWEFYFKNSNDSMLSTFTTISIKQLKLTFGAQVLSRAILDLIVNMIDFNFNKTFNKLNELIEKCRYKSFEEVGYIVTNLLLLLTEYQHDYFRGYDLSFLVIKDFSVPHRENNFDHPIEKLKVPDFTNTNFNNCHITNVDFTNHTHYFLAKNNLLHSTFRNATLNNFKFVLLQIDSVAFLPQKNIIAVGSPNQVRLLNAKNLTLIKIIDDSGWNLEFSPDGKYLINSGYGVLILRNTEDFEVVYNESLSSQYNENAQEDGKNLWTGGFIFTKDSKTVFISNNNSFVYQFDLIKKEESNIFQCFEGAETVSLSYDEKYLVCSEFNAFSVWNLENHRKIKFERINKDSFIKVISKFHPLKNLLFITDENRLRCYNILTDNFDFEIEIQGIGDFCFSLEGDFIYTHNDYEVFIIDVNTKIVVEKHRIEVLNELGKKSHEGINSITLDTVENNLIISTSNQIVLFNLYFDEIVDQFSNILHVNDVDFRDTIGIDNVTKNQLIKNGALI